MNIFYPTKLFIIHNHLYNNPHTYILYMYIFATMYIFISLYPILCNIKIYRIYIYITDNYIFKTHQPIFYYTLVEPPPFPS